MFRFRRFWPLILALGCWLLILLVPATRSGLDAAWSNRFGGSAGDFAVATPVDGTPEIREWTQRFPGNKAVEIFAAARFNGGAELVKRYPDDATIVALALRQQIEHFPTVRMEGPLSNPNYPAPPSPLAPPLLPPGESSPPGLKKPLPVDWKGFLALAARGQKLEPNNSYFSWMRLYGLFATRQDAAARAELARAAQLTIYDDHAREISLNHLDVMRLAHGSPLSPRDLAGVWNTSFGELGRFRQTARWVMESVIADRAAGRHDRALNSASQLVRLARAMRREGYTLINSMVGTACEAIALSSVTLPLKLPIAPVPLRVPLPAPGAPGMPLPPPLPPLPPAPRAFPKTRIGAALGSFQSDPRMLYFYAKSRKRRDITRFLDAEWVELGRWQGGTRMAVASLAGTSVTPPILAIIAAERFAVLCVRALPAILVLGAIFALVARRFRADVGARGVFWRGAAFGGALLATAMLCDAVIVYQSADDSGMMEFNDKYFGGVGLFADLEWWIHLGLAGAVVCFGLNRAVAWQRARRGGQISLLSRLKSTFEAPEDGLARFDFGWVLGLAARVTSWALLLGGTLLFCSQLEGIRTWSEGGLDMGVLALGATLLVSIFLSVAAWHKLPRRRETLRVSCRFIAGALAGFFVTLSVLYTFVAFAVLPLALQNEARFENSMKVGELAMARAQVGF